MHLGRVVVRRHRILGRIAQSGQAAFHFTLVPSKVSRMKLRVLHVETGGSYGGSLRALELYLKHSDRQRFEHHLMLLYPVAGVERLDPYLSGQTFVSSGPGSNTTGPGKALPEAAKTGAPRRFLSEAWDWARLGTGVASSRKIAQLLRQNAYGLVHVNNTFPHQAKLLLAARFANVPVVGHVRNPVEDTRFNRTMMGWTTAVATVSREFERELNQWKLSTTVKTCHDGIEVRKADATKVPALRAKLLRDGTYLFGSVGRLDEQKGYVHFVEAAQVVATQEPGARFVIAGEGPQRRFLQAEIERCGLQDRFELCDFRSVSSSLWEGLPIAIVEAMLLRKPVVATAVGGNAELFPGREDELVRSADPGALAQRLLYRMRTSPARKELEGSATIAATLTDPARSAAVLDQFFAEFSMTSRKEAAAAVATLV
jgi:glycosyltransferase involved in cell wall biosynthesis